MLLRLHIFVLAICVAAFVTDAANGVQQQLSPVASGVSPKGEDALDPGLDEELRFEAAGLLVLPADTGGETCQACTEAGKIWCKDGAGYCVDAASKVAARKDCKNDATVLDKSFGCPLADVSNAPEQHNKGTSCNLPACSKAFEELTGVYNDFNVLKEKLDESDVFHKLLKKPVSKVFCEQKEEDADDASRKWRLHFCAFVKFVFEKQSSAETPMISEEFEKIMKDLFDVTLFCNQFNGRKTIEGCETQCPFRPLSEGIQMLIEDFKVAENDKAKQEGSLELLEMSSQLRHQRRHAQALSHTAGAAARASVAIATRILLGPSCTETDDAEDNKRKGLLNPAVYYCHPGDHDLDNTVIGRRSGIDCSPVCVKRMRNELDAVEFCVQDCLCKYTQKYDVDNCQGRKRPNRRHGMETEYMPETSCREVEGRRKRRGQRYFEKDY